MSLANLPVAAQKAADLKKAWKTAKIPVKFNKSHAFSDGRGVWLEWEMSLESIIRVFPSIESTANRKELVNREFISGAYLETSESKSTRL